MWWPMSSRLFRPPPMLTPRRITRICATDLYRFGATWRNRKPAHSPNTVVKAISHRRFHKSWGSQFVGSTLCVAVELWFGAIMRRLTVSARTLSPWVTACPRVQIRNPTAEFAAMFTQCNQHSRCDGGGECEPGLIYTVGFGAYETAAPVIPLLGSIQPVKLELRPVYIPGFMI